MFMQDPENISRSIDPEEDRHIVPVEEVAVEEVMTVWDAFFLS